MITDITLNRLNRIIARMSDKQKTKQEARIERASLSIQTRIRLATTLRNLKQLQARQAARR